MCCVNISSEETKISDCIRDPVAYCKLTDDIFDRIRYMDELCNEQGNRGESSTTSHHSDGLEKAIQKLNKQGKDDIAKMVSDGQVLEAVQTLEQSENRGAERSQIQGIIKLIRNSKRCKTQAIQQAIQILDNIENRQIYKFIGEAIPDGGQKVRT